MRVSGFVMTDESGEVLAVSVGGAADLAKSLAAPKAAPESPAELVEEHKRLVDVLRSPSHADDLAEADRQEAELAEYEGEMSKSRVAAHVRKDGAFIPEHERRVEAYGVKGMKSTPWRKQFKNQKAFEDWLDKNEGDVEVHGVSHEDHGAMSKAHVQGYTRKDGTFVKEHDDKRQAAQPKQPSVRPVPAQKVNAIADKHSEAMISKSPDWDHNGFRGRKVPAADVAGLPEFSHKEVYGHDGKTSPAATDFAKEFADKGHHGFVIRHPNGKRSFVDTQGYGYARYHAPVEDAPAADAPAQASSSSGKFEYPSHVKNWSDKAHFLEQIPESQRTPEWKAAYKKASVQAMYGKGQSPDYKAHLAASKSGGSVGASYDHPNVVGKADFGKDTPEKGSSMKFAGTEYSATGKTGNSMHDQTPVREFEAEDGHRVWADGAGRVHADSRDEVPALRKKSEGAAKPAAKGAQPKASSPHSDANESGWDSLPDEENPRHALSRMSSQTLGAVAKGKDDLNRRAKVELASRGQDSNGKWIGFAAANKHHGVSGSDIGGNPDEDEALGHMQTVHSKVLGAAARGELDLNKQAKHVLASRGHDTDGKWIGFDAAKRLHGVGTSSRAKPAGKPMAKALMFVGSDASVAELAALTKVSGK